MKKFPFVLLIIITSVTLKAQNSKSISEVKKSPGSGHEGLYALWYKNKNNPDLFLKQPYITGGQMVYQWKELEPEKGKYDFSEIALELQKHQKPLST